MYCLSSRIFLLRNNVYRSFIQFEAKIIPFTTTVTEIPSPQNSQLIDYLVNSLGLSREEAISTSSRFPPATTLDSLNSVPDFLKEAGFSDSHIRDFIIRRPEDLSYVERRLKSRMSILRCLKFSGSALADLVLHSPRILGQSAPGHLTSNIDFLRSYLHSDENVVKVLKKCNGLLVFDLHKRILPNIEILRQYGASEEQISGFLFRCPRFLVIRSDRLEDNALRARNMGFSTESKLFIYAVYIVSALSKATLESKLNLFKSFGWSESDILATFKKIPMFLGYSECKVRAMMDFFLEELGYDPKEMTQWPKLLTYSLEKRLVPRNNVLKILVSRGLIKRKPQLIGVASFTEEKFLKIYVLPYVELAPDIQEAYMGSIVK